MLRNLLAPLALTATLTFGAPAVAGDRSGCNTEACERRVLIRLTHDKWRAAVNAYGTATLRARERCEAGGHGGWRLVTTGNGFYFGHQFVPSSWAAVGGRLRAGVPVGRWARHPSRLEQDYRAVRLDAIQADPWPNCP